MNKTLRVLERAAIVHLRNAAAVTAIVFAGWQYVRVWIWVARQIHKTPHETWDAAIGCTFVLAVLGTVALIGACSVGIPALCDYFTGVWHTAEREVEAETVSAEARETLLRGSDDI